MIQRDYRQECSNKKPEDVILNSVAAFANSQGGTLLIGIDDKGEPLGLDREVTPAAFTPTSAACRSESTDRYPASSR